MNCATCKMNLKEKDLVVEVHRLCHFLKGIEDQLKLINKYTQATVAAVQAAR